PDPSQKTTPATSPGMPANARSRRHEARGRSGLASSAPGWEDTDLSRLTNANPSPTTSPPPSPLTSAESDPIQIVNAIASNSPRGVIGRDREQAPGVSRR